MLNEKMIALGSSRSVIRELFEYGKILKEKVGEENVFDFTLGNPYVPCPDEVNDYAIEVIKNDKSAHAYTSAQGDLLARKAICDYNYNKYGYKLNENLIYMTCGAAAAIKIAFSSIISDCNEEILAVAPFFPEYRVFAETSGAKFNYVNCDEENFLVDFNELEKSINKNTRALIINTPNNPSGAVYDENTIIKISEILDKKQKEYGYPIYLISDEPYREILFDGAVCPFVPKYYKNTIICYSYSKALSLPGERIGYVAISPEADLKEDLYFAIMGAGRALGYVCAPSLWQKVLIKHANKTSETIPYKDNRDILIEALEKLNFKCVNPKGAFYLFVKSPIENAVEFSNIAKTYGLLLVPSDSFGVKGYIRIATCVSKDTAVNSIPYFTKLAKDLKMI
ncbi:MAG: pyridoxal phosphate-dependent aminotransferase [Clostridia bacterium]|nr:pyridoxal phosphate-dependent aminotransferase [Clostridia bacterium]